MKNIHLLLAGESHLSLNCSYRDSAIGTEVGKPYWTYSKDWKHHMSVTDASVRPHNMYITSNSKFVRDEYITDGIEVIKATPKLVDAQGLVDRRDWNKIIITTDQELIKDGVHSIGEEFLKWFVENPTCTKVEVVYGLFNTMGRQVDPNDLGQNHSKCIWKYKIITTKEESKLQCKDCNDNLTDCTCTEDTVDMKQETIEYDLLQHIKFCLECKNESQAIRLIEKYGFQKQEERYSEEEVMDMFHNLSMHLPLHYEFLVKEQFKKK